jgi:hypothetical protein
MLAKSATYTESQRSPVRLAELRSRLRHDPPNTTADASASVVEAALDIVACAAVFVRASPKCLIAFREPTPDALSESRMGAPMSGSVREAT